MARMYARKRGKSGSNRPLKTGVHKWVAYKKDEVEKLVLKLKNEGNQSASIGTLLRDQYGIPLVKDITNKKITKILKENKAESKIPEDLLNLIKHAVKINGHLKNNKKDVHSKRSLQLTESKIRRLSKYYKKNKVLPKDWNYNIDKANLLVE